MKPPVGSFPPAVDPSDAATNQQVTSLESNIARGSYITVALSADQVNPAGDSAVAFDTVVQSRGSLTNSGGTISGLKAGRTYLLISSIRTLHTSSFFAAFHWWDVTGGAEINDYWWTQRSPNLSDSRAEPALGAVLFTPTVDSQVEVRLRSGSTAGVDIDGGSPLSPSIAQVIEIGSTQVIGSEWIPLETKEVTGAAIENFEFDYPIDGNRDEAYKVEFFIKTAAATTRDLRIRVNDLISSTNVAAASSQSSGNHGTYTDLVLARTIRDYVHGYFIFNCAENPMGGAVAHPRTLTGEMVFADDPASGTGIFDVTWGAVWSDAGNLTRMVIQNTQQSQDTGVSEIDVGTVMRLYRKARPSDYVKGQIGVVGEALENVIRCGTVDSNDSAVEKRVCVFEFDPTNYDLDGANRSLVFRAVAANGGGIAQTKVRLYNLTDGGISVAELTFTSASMTKLEQALVEGASPGQIPLSPKLYEVTIFCVSPDGTDDSIELGSAELVVTNTLV